ncbi:MAG: tRNA glutamyl-Q(34) synthetase GluQRS [Acidimicrobiales bacterium]
MPSGRFAPSPTGPLHLGNLRTGLLAWLFARSSMSRFILRMEDLDPGTARPEHEASQLADLATIGLDWDGAVARQSERRALYDDAIAKLESAGLTYSCFCTRSEIRTAASAPNGFGQPEGAYPGTCRKLSRAQQAELLRGGRRPALRLRAGDAVVTVTDRIAGSYTATVDDVVLRRGDGTPAYNLAVVVDDAEQGIGEVVRADDLLASTPRQMHIAHLLGLPVPAYAHVPLVLAPDGARLAKRHGAVTLGDRVARGESPPAVLGLLARSLGLAAPGEAVHPAELVERFDLSTVTRRPWTFAADPAERSRPNS